MAAAVVKAQSGGWRSHTAAPSIALLGTLVEGLLGAAAADKGSTAAALRQQLYEGALLAALPDILTAAASDMLACSAAAMGFPCLSQGCSKPQNLAGSSGSTDRQCHCMWDLCQHTSEILAVPAMLVKLWDTDSFMDSPAASCLEPTVQLAAATLDLMCSYLEQQQEPPAVAPAHPLGYTPPLQGAEVPTSMLISGSC